MTPPAIIRPARPASAADILAAVSERTGISVADIKGRSRLGPIVKARQEAMWALRETPKPFTCANTINRRSWPEIGRLFGRDHTTVIHGYRAHEKRALGDIDFHYSDLKGAA